MNIIFANFGNNSIALMQWAFLQQLADVTVVHVDTGWAAAEWQQRVRQGTQYAKRCDFQIISLTAKASFQDLVIDRNSFPTPKFQYCAGFLKGLTFLQWADEVDPGCEATVLLGSRRADSRARVHLPEIIECSEHFGGRRVRYPLFAHDNNMLGELITQAGFDRLPHRSLECDPCIHSQASDFTRMSEATISRLAALEKQVGKPMFGRDIDELVQSEDVGKKASVSLENFDMGCGSPYGCGE